MDLTPDSHVECASIHAEIVLDSPIANLTFEVEVELQLIVRVMIELRLMVLLVVVAAAPESLVQDKDEDLAAEEDLVVVWSIDHGCTEEDSGWTLDS